MSNLVWFNNVPDLMSKGQANPMTNTFPLYSGPFVLVKDALGADGTSAGPRQDVELVSGRLFKATLGSDEYAVVVLCRMMDVMDTTSGAVSAKPQWSIYCGDKQVSGEFRADGKTLASQLRKEGKVSNKVANLLEASDWVGKIPAMASCGFFRMQKRNGSYCTHTQAVLANTPKEEFEQMATELQGWLAGDDTSLSSPTGPLSPEEEAFYDAAFIQHVMLAGERGSGKSYLARQAADKYDAVYLEMQMHPSMEAWEFRAHDRAWNGKVYTVLGKLAEAVYWIQKGKKVVLCMDEFLNMNPLYATTINTPLSLTERDTYIIETGRIIDLGDGIGQIETVEVPADSFWVVATSNIGARYGLDKIAPSVRARFQIILMNTNPERTKTIVEKNLDKYGMPFDLSEMFRKFIEACNQAVAENTLDEEATTRLACNVLRACHMKAKRDKKSYSTTRQWLPQIKKQLMLEIAQVVNFELGPLDSDQEARYKALVDGSFK
ncbi:deoxyadenosine kinase [Novimethylophilus kurashikiensis]|uniref:Deoxyadenosine kinase n=1 Tax=Novimethylophilus kurashikiensis TaxID=1825523 RepID=A0A2R5F8K6_9PROT|nr:AAA family ATPase [Novimethylophilus kurashikiensis]GBG14365.1 deoxyadenosine kinase [Novimethylophilus kurashikiensis]